MNPGARGIRILGDVVVDTVGFRGAAMAVMTVTPSQTVTRARGGGALLELPAAIALAMRTQPSCRSEEVSQPNVYFQTSLTT